MVLGVIRELEEREGEVRVRRREADWGSLIHYHPGLGVPWCCL
ncbi:hypothetical protein [Vulcanisaeta distributa]